MQKCSHITSCQQPIILSYVLHSPSFNWQVANFSTLYDKRFWFKVIKLFPLFFPGLSEHVEEAPTPPTIDTSKIVGDSEQFAHLPDDDPLKNLCTKHPVLEVCQNLHKDKAERPDVDKKTRSIAWYIKTFTKTINGFFYAFFLLVVECIRTFFIRIFEYTFGLVFWLIGRQEVCYLWFIFKTR